VSYVEVAYDLFVRWAPPQTQQPPQSQQQQQHQSTYYQLLGVDRHADTAAIWRAYLRLCLVAHPAKGGDAAHFAWLTAAYDVLCDDVQRTAYERDLADEGAHGLLENDCEEHGVEWVLLSALRLEEESIRWNVHQLNEEHAKVLEEESSVTDEMLEKKNEQLQKKKAGT
jgi:curved DNA-binding protein CbpA